MDSSKLPKQGIYLHRAVVVWGLGVLLAGAGCTTLPEPKFQAYEFPENVYLATPKGRAFEELGVVRTKVTYGTLTESHDEADLCKNYFNKAAEKLLKAAQKKGGDGVIELRSVVVHLDGKSKTYSSAQCNDEGAEGQVLAQGMAVRWKKEK
jgi:uncharacterized protein YbjQ (UPF0145 family)